MAVFRQKYVVLGMSGCFRAKVVLFEKSGCIRVKVVVFGKSCCIRAKWLYSGKNGCIRAKVDLLVQKCLYSGIVVVFGQNWLFSGKVTF